MNMVVQIQTVKKLSDFPFKLLRSRGVWRKEMRGKCGGGQWLIKESKTHGH